jgi:hypothetical protein
MRLGETQNEIACHPDPAVAGEGPLKISWFMVPILCDPRSIGEIPRRAWDDRVVCLAGPAKAAAT